MKLSVNVDHVATLREARKIDRPDPVAAAILAELAGADGITVHLRSDRRHIQDRDVRILRQTIKTKLNLEMSTDQSIVKFALEVRPDQVTFVPEKPEEVTTEGGLLVTKQLEVIRSIIPLFHEREIKVSIFVDPDLDQIKAARECGADMVEIHMGRYCEARKEADRLREYRLIINAVKLASKIKLEIAAGHGLDYTNVGAITAISLIKEFNIGQSIIARAVLVGIDRAVREMIEAMRNGSPLEGALE
jgi:pyridoxine 5-phosphate synthase